MVALDESLTAKSAFYTAVAMMDASRDKLFLITVVSLMKSTGPQWAFVPSSVEEMVQEKAKAAGKELLHRYAKLCEAKKIPYKAILGVSNHSNTNCFDSRSWFNDLSSN